MAVDTRNKRASLLGFLEELLAVLPNPDGTVNADDRGQLASAYSGLLPTASIDTRDERACILGFMDDLNVVFPNPDGSLGISFDRRHILASYRDEPSGAGIAGNGSAVAAAVGALDSGIPLDAAVAAEATATGLLVSGIVAFNAAVAGEAASTGALTTAIRLAGLAASVASASGNYNRPPVLTGAPVTPSFIQGTPASYSVAGFATDPDGDQLVVVHSPGPLGLLPGITYDQAQKKFDYDGRSYGLTAGQTTSTPFHRLSYDDSNGFSALARVHGGEAGILTQVIALAGSAAGVASGSGLLTVPADLTVLASAVASATGLLGGGSGFEVLAAGEAGVTATLTSVMPFAATATANANTVADFFTQGTTALNAAATGQSAVVASLSTEIRLLGSAQADASPFARLGPDYIFFTVAAGLATATGQLTAPGKKGTWNPESEELNAWTKELAA